MARKGSSTAQVRDALNASKLVRDAIQNPTTSRESILAFRKGITKRDARIILQETLRQRLGY